MSLLNQIGLTIVVISLAACAYAVAIATDERRWCMSAIAISFVAQTCFWETRRRWEACSESRDLADVVKIRETY